MCASRPVEQQQMQWTSGRPSAKIPHADAEKKCKPSPQHPAIGAAATVPVMPPTLCAVMESEWSWLSADASDQDLGASFCFLSQPVTAVQCVRKILPTAFACFGCEPFFNALNITVLYSADADRICPDAQQTGSVAPIRRIRPRCQPSSLYSKLCDTLDHT